MHSKYGFNAGKRLESGYYYDFNPFCALDSPRNLSLCSGVIKLWKKTSPEMALSDLKEPSHLRNLGLRGKNHLLKRVTQPRK